MLAEKKAKNCEWLFILGYFFFLSYSLLIHIEILQGGVKFFGIIAIIVFLICFISQINNFSNEEFVGLILLLVISFVFSMVNSYLLFFKTVLILMASKGVNVKRIIKFDFWIRIFLIIFVFVLWGIGVAPDVTFGHKDYVRHSFGFTGPNALSSTVMILVFDFLYINGLKFKVSSLLFVLPIAILSNYYTKSRTGFYIIIIALFLSLIYTYRPKVFANRCVKAFICYSFILCSIATYIIFIGYRNGNEWGEKINELLSQRLERIEFFGRIFEVNLWGNNLALTLKSLDNSYAFLLYGQGILLFVVYALASTVLMKRLYQIGDMPLAVIMLLFFFFGISEMLWLNSDANIFMIAYSFVLFRRKRHDD